MDEKKQVFKLIITIVNKGTAASVIESSQAAGAEGATVINGRGTSLREQNKIFGIPIEPEKEVVMIVVDADKAEKILNKIVDDAEINVPGKGIAFIIDVEKVVGI